MGTMNYSWCSIKQEFENIANSHQTFSTKLLSDIHDVLSEQMREEKKTRTPLVINGKKLCKDLVQAEAEMLKERKDYVKLRKTQEKCQEELNKSQQNPKIQKKLE